MLCILDPDKVQEWAVSFVTVSKILPNPGIPPIMHPGQGEKVPKLIYEWLNFSVISSSSSSLLYKCSVLQRKWYHIHFSERPVHSQSVRELRGRLRRRPTRNGRLQDLPNRLQRDEDEGRSRWERLGALLAEVQHHQEKRRGRRRLPGTVKSSLPDFKFGFHEIVVDFLFTGLFIRSLERFCKMFSESSPCLLGQHGSCSTAQWPGKLS